MARYTSFFVVSVPLERFRGVLLEILKECHLDIVHEKNDYIMARETLGQVPLAKLVTAEILIDTKIVAANAEIKMNFVLKNEELPLKLDNHCRQVFEFLSQLIMEHRQWKILDLMAI